MKWYYKRLTRLDKKFWKALPL